MRRLFTVFGLLFLSFAVYGQNGFYQLNFESSGGYTTSVSESTDGDADYFTRTNGSDISATLTNKEGSYFFAVQDKDAAPTPVSDPAYLDISSIDISGQTGLVFSVLLAEDDASDGNEDWDVGDYVHIYYQIDGGGYKNMIWVESDGTQSLNTKPLIDTDFDGTGDGQEITSSFSEFTFNIPETGSSLDIRFEFKGLNTGDEDIAIDNIIVGSDASPTPVELTTFTAKTDVDAVVLNWQTATEVNNYGFQVQRKNEKVQSSWVEVGFVPGHGNSNSPKEYSFVDENVPSGNVQYRLKQIDIDGQFEYSDVVEVSVDVPLKFALSQNYPNPFNPSTEISFTLPADGNVKLTIFNALGQEVAKLLNTRMTAGSHKIKFDASNLSGGVYFYKLQSGNLVQVNKMMLLK